MADEIVLTEHQRRALEALVELAGPIESERRASARQVARVLWPDSSAWGKRTGRIDGRSGAKGGTMPMKAGRVLSELARLGLVYEAPDPIHAAMGAATPNLWAPTNKGRSLAGRASER